MGLWISVKVHDFIPELVTDLTGCHQLNPTEPTEGYRSQLRLPYCHLRLLLLYSCT